jgi:putative PIN family toxin of toxin-antitoxin system
MHVVLDTNTVISGLLWHGPPRQIFTLAREGKIRLFTTSALLEELSDVLHREKFVARLALTNLTPAQLIVGYAALATRIEPFRIPPTIIADPDDDAVLACALAAEAKIIVSGDHHLLQLQQYEKIEIMRATEFLSKNNAL